MCCLWQGLLLSICIHIHIAYPRQNDYVQFGALMLKESEPYAIHIVLPSCRKRSRNDQRPHLPYDLPSLHVHMY